MRPRGFALGLAITMMSAVLWALGGPVAAGEATDQIRSHIDQMYRLVNWLAMAQGALGQHWGERTPAERAEFVRLFGDVFERAYLSKIQLADAQRFAYLGDTIEGDHTVVRTQITTNNGTVIPVNYRAGMVDGRTWRVYDLDVGGVSLVNNYRAQFNSIIARSSYPELVNRLKALRGQRGGAGAQRSNSSGTD